MTDFSGRAVTLPEAISGALGEFGGFLRCATCGGTAPLGDPGRRVTTTGWPSCCGYTMTWWTQRQIDAGEVPEIAPAPGVSAPGGATGPADPPGATSTEAERG